MFLIPVEKIKNYPGAEESISLKRGIDPKRYHYQGFKLQDEVGFLGLAFNNQGIITIEGNYKGKVILECDRCGKDFEYLLEGDFSEAYALEGILDDSGEKDVHAFSGTEIDISRQLLQNMSLLLPMKNLCRENCEGLCLQCGADLNLESCSCEAPIDPRLEILKNFKLEGR